MDSSHGPLHGIRVLEFEAIGPGPFAGMLLADLGADVLVVDRPADSDLGLKRERWYDVMMRGKRSVTLDLKPPAAKEAALSLLGKADALIEGFRPGVMERLGLGQEVDAAMVEGASLLAAMFHGFLKADQWSETRGANILDTGAPWYDVYETRDGKHVAIGAIETKFYADLLSRLNLRSENLPGQYERARWPELREAFASAFKKKTRDEWSRAFEGSDACFAPVLSFSEARQHPHNVSRKAFIELAGVAQPAPAPRFSRTPGAVRRPPPERGEGGLAALADWGFSAAEVERLRSAGLGHK